jgi:hypothetical protein
MEEAMREEGSNGPAAPDPVAFYDRLCFRDRKGG